MCNMPISSLWRQHLPTSSLVFTKPSVYCNNMREQFWQQSFICKNAVFDFSIEMVDFMEYLGLLWCVHVWDFASFRGLRNVEVTASDKIGQGKREIHEMRLLFPMSSNKSAGTLMALTRECKARPARNDEPAHAGASYCLRSWKAAVFTMAIRVSRQATHQSLYSFRVRVKSCARTLTRSCRTSRTFLQAFKL